MSGGVGPDGIKTLRVIISGRVQGVWFRGWTEDQARARRLDGWVRNRPDGTVEAVFSGEPFQVDEMIESCRVGPPAARVTRIETFSDAERPAPGFAQTRY